MDTEIIKQVTSAKYLGITSNENLMLQWAEHISRLQERLVLHWVLYRNLKNCLPFIKNLSYKTLILECACTIWNLAIIHSYNNV